MFIEILHRESGITASAISHSDASHECIHAIMRRKSDGMAEIRHMAALLKQAARLFRHFAPLHGIEKKINLRAANRSGAYACELTAKRDRGEAWRDLVLRARQFGIYENELEGLAIWAEQRNASFKARSGARSVASK